MRRYERGQRRASKRPLLLGDARLSNMSEALFGIKLLLE